MTKDLVNAAFELLGGMLLALNCQRLYRDRKVAGVHVAPFAFYAAWGYWNLYYYPSLSQSWSFAAGIVPAASNTVWVVMALLLKSGRWK